MAVKNIFDITKPDYMNITEGDIHYGPERFIAGNLPTVKSKGIPSLFAAQAGELDDEARIMDAVLRMKMTSGLMSMGETVPNDDDELIIKYFKLIGDPTE